MTNRQLEMWRKLCRCRAFELNAALAHRQKRFPAPIYLSIGQETIPATLTTICRDWVVFAQHRCHSWYLSLGGDQRGLIRELCGSDAGCNGGMAGSASISLPPNMFGHSGLLGDQIPVACGYALASGRSTLCVMGDAAVEEDYALASFGFAATKCLPMLFVVEDNGLSILTKTEVRRSWLAAGAALGLGLSAFESSDDPDVLATVVREALGALPALINVKTSRHYWHAGSGQDAVVQQADDWLYKYCQRLCNDAPAATAEVLSIMSTECTAVETAWDAEFGSGWRAQQ